MKILKSVTLASSAAALAAAAGLFAGPAFASGPTSTNSPQFTAHPVGVHSFGATAITAAAAATGTSVVTLEVSSPFANPGDVQVQDLTSGNVLATCQGSSSPGTATCAVDVPTGDGVLFVAQPLTAGAFKDWTAACGSTPGPICHRKVTKAVKVVGHFAAAHTPSAVTTTTYVEGDTPGCSGFSDVVTVDGTGFPAETAVTLSDDGQQVASGMTDSSGSAQLQYTANSEPGIYRNLVMAAAGVSSSTDIYNEASYCLNQNGAGSGTDSFEVIATDLDANSSGTIRFASNPAVPEPANAQGVSTVTTPAYACKAGAAKNLVITGVRGAGTSFSFKSVVTFAVVC